MRLVPGQLFLLLLQQLCGLALLLKPLLLRESHVVQLLEGIPVYPLALGVVLLQRAVLKAQLLDFLAHHFVLRGSHFAILIALEDVHLPLELFVLPVQEVYLALQLDDALLVLLILVLEVDLLKVLSRRVEVVKAEYLFITHLDLAFEILREFLLDCQSLLHLVQDLVELLAAVVSFAQFLSPLVLLPEDVLLNLQAHRHGVEAICASLTVHQVDFLERIGHFHALFMALHQICVVLAVELAEAVDDLVLARLVYPLQSLLHLRLELHLLLLKVSDSLVF